MSGFTNARVALLEARMSSELAGLVRRFGAVPYSVPAVREASLNAGAEVAALLDKLRQSSLHAIVFFTGAGVTTLIQEAERLQRLPELLTALQTVLVVCRGPKPAAVLKRYNIPIAANAHEPYTTNELLAALATLDLAGSEVGVVHYGERNLQLTQTLHKDGIQLVELCLYEWLLPRDPGPLRTLVREIIAGQVDAVVFTSQIQARHLFRVAEEKQANEQLVQALNTRTIVASVGPTCTAALHELGVTPHVEPEHPKAGHLIKALAEFMQ